MTDPIPRYQKLLEEYPDNELARFSLGKAFFDLKQWEAAREQLALALARKPDWMVAQILAGKCDSMLGNPAEARRAFERARQLALDQDHKGPLEEIDRLLTELV
jgi:tetratricopeptide (TPR) repeat protein